MSTFTTTRNFEATPAFIPFAIERIRENLSGEGFEFQKKEGAFGKTVIEVTKGNLVKQIVGLRQGLEISFRPEGNRIDVTAKGIVLKNQVIAGALSYFVFWPVLISQVIGLIKQSRLDDRTMEIIADAHRNFVRQRPSFCPHCGSRVLGEAVHCPTCGKAL